MNVTRKLKTKSSLKARFKVTKTGKIMRRAQNMRHLRRKKRKSTIHAYRVPRQITGKFATRLRRVMGIKKRKQ